MPPAASRCRNSTSGAGRLRSGAPVGPGGRSPAMRACLPSGRPAAAGMPLPPAAARCWRMAFKEITYDVDAGRAHIKFNRPEKLNALTPLLLQELNDALWEADDDRRVHAVCVSGTGRCFSAGYDLGGAAVARKVSTDEDGPRHRTGATFDDDVWFLE